MKNYLLKTKRNSRLSSDRRSLIQIFLATIAAILIILLLRDVIGTLFSGVTMRVERTRNYFATSGDTLPSYIRDRNQLNAEINRLKEELSKQSGFNATIARLTRENEELRSLLSNTGEERILAGVIARPPTIPYDLLVLDQGQTSGVQEGALVYHNGDHVLGMINKVYERTSLVTLFSSAGAETTVYIYGPNVLAYAYGEGGGVIRISVPQGIELALGDPIVLPTVRGGDLGVIERIESLPSQPEQSAYSTFPAPLQTVRTVSIGKTVYEIKQYEDVIPDIENIKERFRIEVPDTARTGGVTSTEPISTTTESTTSPESVLPPL